MSLVFLGIAIILLAIAVFLIDKKVTSLSVAVIDLKAIANRIDLTATRIYLDAYTKAKADVTKVETSIKSDVITPVSTEVKALVTDATTLVEKL